MVMANSKQLHIVAIPFPFYGHVTPLMELCFKLAETLPENSKISFINVPHYHALMTESLRHRLRVCPSIRLCSLPDSDIFPASANPSDPQASLRQNFDYIATTMASQAETLICSMELPVSFLVADIRLPFSKSLSENLGVAWIAFWTQSAACYAYHAMAAMEGFILPTDESTVIEDVPGVPPHTIADVPSVFRLGRYLFDYVTKPFKGIAEGGATTVLINTFQALEHETLLALNRSDGPFVTNQTQILSVGPLLPPESQRNNAKNLHKEEHGDVRREEEENKRFQCMKWLDVHPPASVIYISFGTLYTLAERQLLELTHGIEASGQRFLWSVREHQISASSFDIEAFKDRTRDRGLVVDWTPQLHVLSHPAIGGFMSHCGWNSCLESFALGVPLLGFPQASDQTLSMRCIADSWKVGLFLKVGEDLQRKEVENKIRLLICGQESLELRKSARKLKEAAAMATNEGGSSFANLNLLVNALVHP